MNDLALTLRRTSPPEYIRWHEKRIISCVDFLRRQVALSGKRVLDIGHDVHIGALLHAEGAELVGNIAPNDMSGAHEEATAASWQLDAFNFEERFPYQDGSFDVVTAMEVFEHVGTSPRAFLAEVNRVLKPGGHVFIGTPNAGAWVKILKMLAHETPMDTRPFSQNWGPRHAMCHVYEFTPWEVRFLLDKEGFEVERLSTWDVYDLDPRGPRKALARALIASSLLITGHFRQAALMYRNRGHQMAVVARKR